MAQNSGKSGIVLVREFFSTEERPLGTDELKQLSAEERNELAEAVAKQRGLTPVKAGNGVTLYHEQAA